jgi:rubrerythrin
MERENLLNFITLCKSFELNPTVSQISPIMVKAFKDAKLFDLLPIERREYLKELFSDLKDDKELYGRRIGQSAIMLLCMSDKRTRQIAAVQDAPKENNTIEFVCINCGTLTNSVNAPEKQGCCDKEKYIKNII